MTEGRLVTPSLRDREMGIGESVREQLRRACPSSGSGRVCVGVRPKADIAWETRITIRRCYREIAKAVSHITA